MQGKSRRWKKKLNNVGSTLVTVLVGVSFLLILATMTIAISAGNLHMKQVEYAIKDNFYADEQVLDDVYNGIGKVTTDCLSDAYADILSQVSGADGNAVFKTQDAAYRAFSVQFMKYLTNYLPVCSSSDADTSNYTNLRNKLQSYIIKNKKTVTDEFVAEVVKFDRTEILDEEGNVYNSIGTKLPWKYVIRDVEVKYRRVNETSPGSYTKTGYESVITTDIVIEIPYINFFRDSSTLLDYALIGNKGIYFESTNKENPRIIEGNVYAGTCTTETEENKKKFRDEDVYGGINFYNCAVNFSSNYLISKGDMNIRNATVNIGNANSIADTQLWVESLRTVESINKNDPVEQSALTVNGNMYVANDLELNARDSNVDLNGQYYGYSNGAFVDVNSGNALVNQNQETKNLQSKYKTIGHTQSSSIIINGNKSTLDLSGLDTLVIAGVAYIDLQSQTYSGDAINNNGGTSSGLIEEYATGESLALRTNQYMYLAPSSILTTTNPVKTSEMPGSVWLDDTSWFGIAKGFVNAGTPITMKEVINRTTGESYTYFYLNFADNNKKKEYARLVLNMTDPDNHFTDMHPKEKEIIDNYGFTTDELQQIWEIKKNLKNKAENSSVKPTINLANDVSASIYTRGEIAQVSDTKGLISQMYSEESFLSSDFITKVEHNLVKHYQYLIAELDPKEEFSLTSQSLSIINYEIPDDAPVSKYVSFDGMVNGSESPNYKCGYKTHVYVGNYTLTDSSFKGIIICDGDVTIPSGVSVEGLVIASGKIIVQGSGKIVANRSIVQAILDEERTEESKKESASEKNMKYASTYLKEFRLADSEYSGKDYTNRISSTEYTDYISYQNWRKGEIN